MIISKYFLSTFLLILFSSIGFSQNTIQKDPNIATVTIVVADMDNKPREFEKIQFENLESGDKYEGISNEEGKFDIDLPGDAAYSIKIKSIGDAEDYNKLSIPALKENEMYGPMELTIQFEPAREFTLDNVKFFSGKATITNASYSELNELVEFMKLKNKVVVEISGHTDNVGEPESNMKLSVARAEAVRNYLISKSIDSNRILAIGYGETRPVDSNDTEKGRSSNRRTEVRIVSE